MSSRFQLWNINRKKPLAYAVILRSYFDHTSWNVESYCMHCLHNPCKVLAKLCATNHQTQPRISPKCPGSEGTQCIWWLHLDIILTALLGNLDTLRIPENKGHLRRCGIPRTNITSFGQQRESKSGQAGLWMLPEIILWSNR